MSDTTPGPPENTESQPLPEQAVPTPPTRKHVVPKQKQISPELEALQRKERNRKRNLGRRRTVYRLLTIPGVILLCISAYFGYTSWLAWQKKVRIVANSGARKSVEPAVQTALPNAASDDLIARMNRLDEAMRAGGSDHQFVDLFAKKQLAEQLIELKQGEVYVSIGVVEKLNSLITMSAVVSEQPADKPEFRHELLSFSTEHLASPNPKVVALAIAGVLIAKITEFIRDPSETNLDAAMAAIESNLSNFPAQLDPQFLRIVVALLGKVQNPVPTRQIKQCLAKQFMAHGSTEEQALGQALWDQSIIGSVDFESMRPMAATGSSFAITELEGVLTNLASSPEVSISVYLNVISVFERLHQTKEKSRERELFALLQSTVEKIADDTTRQKIQTLLEHYETRRSLVGAKFRFDSGAPAEQELDPAAIGTVVAFVSGAADVSDDWLKTLAEQDLANVNEQYVVICVDESELSPETRQNLIAAIPHAKFIWPPFGQTYLKQCTPSWTPYMILTDRDSVVEGIDLGISDLKTRIIKPAK